MIKHIIFDLDGVLIDAVDIHFRAFKRAVEKYTPFVISEQFHAANLNGLPTKTKLQKLGIMDFDLIEAINNFKQEETFAEFGKIQLDKDLFLMLYSLRERGYKLSCASNSISNTVHLALTRLGIIKLFDFFIGNDCVDLPKPAPNLYYKCMMETKCWTNETLAIEDSPVGKRTIENAGVYGLMVKDRQDVSLAKIMHRIGSIDLPINNLTYKIE